MEDLHTATRDILGRAIEARGTTFDSYHDAFGETGKYQHQLKVFTRAGEPCPRCGTEITKSRVAGRGTYTCPGCQPLERSAVDRLAGRSDARSLRKQAKKAES
jgi:formamidopyrimidine-DNA glycosylase